MTNQQPVADVPPKADGLPLLGNTHQLLRRNLFDFMMNLTDKYGDFVRLNVAGKDLLLLSNPDAIENVLINKNERYKKADSKSKPRLHFSEMESF